MADEAAVGKYVYNMYYVWKAGGWIQSIVTKMQSDVN